MFHVGQKVVCIDTSVIPPFYKERSLNGLTVGEVYTVKWIGEFDHPMWGIDLCVHVKEILRPHNIPYRASRFRPLVIQKSSSFDFHKLLDPNYKIQETEKV
jgi:hypothetical protein